jgi:hypothetical protein
MIVDRRVAPVRSSDARTLDAYRVLIAVAVGAARETKKQEQEE